MQMNLDLTSSGKEVLIPLKASFHIDSVITSKANNFTLEFIILSSLQYHRNLQNLFFKVNCLCWF